MALRYRKIAKFMYPYLSEVLIDKGYSFEGPVDDPSDEKKCMIKIDCTSAVYQKSLEDALCLEEQRRLYPDGDVTVVSISDYKDEKLFKKKVGNGPWAIRRKEEPYFEKMLRGKVGKVG